MPFAFSESITIQVPFESTGYSCTHKELAVEYVCIFQGQYEEFTLEDLEEWKPLLSESMYADELQRLQEEAIAEFEEEKQKLTITELKIIELETKLRNGNGEVKDSVLMNLLKELNTCIAGQEGSRSASIQQEMEFEISDFELWTMNNIEYRGAIGKLVKSNEACKSQTILENQILSEKERNLVKGDEDVQFSLHTKYENEQAIPYDKYHATDSRVDMNGICGNPVYDWNNKIMLGCPDTRDYGDTSKIRNPMGVIHYYSDAYSKYSQYIKENNRLATTEDWKNAEKKAEPTLNDMLKENSWYNRE